MMRPILPRTILLDYVTATVAFGAGAMGSLVALTRRNLEEKGITSFRRVWRLPYKVEVSVKVGRGRFRRAWPYRPAWDVNAGARAGRVVDTTAEPVEVAPDPGTNIERAARAWGLSPYQREILYRVVGCFENKEIADQLSRSENQIAREVSRIYERANVPDGWGNRRMHLMEAVHRFPAKRE